MTDYFLTEASVQIYVRQNTLFSTYKGKLTTENLITTLRIWSSRLSESRLIYLSVDFSGAIVEAGRPLQKDIDVQKYLPYLQEITIQPPKELFSRILLKQFIRELKNAKSLLKMNFRFMDSELFNIHK